VLQDLTLLEQQLLLAILRLHPVAYGVSIQETIKTAGRAYSIGAIYSALERLEYRGFVRARQGEATAERGGRRKTYFVLSAQGQHALQASLHTVDALRAGSPPREAWA
jgi:PadR family transcriptional regulator PadR